MERPSGRKTLTYIFPQTSFDNLQLSNQNVLQQLNSFAFNSGSSSTTSTGNTNKNSRKVKKEKENQETNQIKVPKSNQRLTKSSLEPKNSKLRNTQGQKKISKLKAKSTPLKENHENYIVREDLKSSINESISTSILSNQSSTSTSPRLTPILTSDPISSPPSSMYNFDNSSITGETVEFEESKDSEWVAILNELEMHTSVPTLDGSFELKLS